ncbi:MAG: alpha/beta hydrolase [Ignavibacteriales bacterium]|nr:alpha/beta hydrolase [Ignavibacteriales bacterium]
MTRRFISTLKVGGLTLAGTALALGLWIGVEFIALRGETPAITGENGQKLTRSIATLERIKLGGIEQYVLIRGTDSTKPLLLFLHGGPGMPVMYLAHAFQRDLENFFVLVHWDRRGAGKSYGACVRSDSLTLRQTLNDTFELTEHLLTRFGHHKLFLVAHSWGTLLGLLAVKEHPEYYAAYIGTGQLSADSLRRYLVQRRFLYNMARAYGDNDLIEWLIGGGPVHEDDLFRYGGGLQGARSFMPILLTGLRAPEYDLFDALNVPRGASFVAERMKDDMNGRDFEKHLRVFKVPIYFFLGRHDYITPSVLAAEYLGSVRAPLKQLVWFEYSAHFPFWEEQRKFTAEMIRIQNDVTAFQIRHSAGLDIPITN